jgi:hypothetical protein
VIPELTLKLKTTPIKSKLQDKLKKLFECLPGTVAKRLCGINHPSTSLG